MSAENLIQTDSITFLDNLRSKTSESHKSLEAIPISKLLVNPNISLHVYSLYLSLMHDVVNDFEKFIYPLVDDVILDISERKKASLILNDLKSIGEEKQKGHTFLKNSDQKYSVPFALGMLYVLEGSTLGGRFILKNIQENLGLDEENGVSYFSGYGNKTGSYWKKFLAYFTEFEAQNNTEEEIIAGADFAFTIIGKHLSENSSL